MNIKSRILAIMKYLILMLIYAVVFIASSFIFPVSKEIANAIPASESGSTGYLLFLCIFINSTILIYAINRSRWHGLKLIISMIIIIWGFQTFMTQIETFIFIKAFPLISFHELMLIFIRGLFSTIIFVPLAVLMTGKMKNLSLSVDKGEIIDSKSLTWKIPVLSVFYCILYFLFGLFPMSFPEVKAFYSTWASSSNQLFLILIQIIRGFFWVLISLPVIKMTKGNKTEKIIILVLLISIVPIIQLILPNPVMPPLVRLAHFIEVFLSNSIFGVLIGLILICENKTLNKD